MGRHRIFYCTLITFLFLNFLIAKADPEKQVSQKFVDLRKFDISKAIKPSHEFLGFIEPDFQRLRIEFTNIQKDPQDPTTYMIQGTSQVRSGPKVKLKGTLKITSAQEIYRPNQGQTDISDKVLGQNGYTGSLEAVYELNEDRHQKNSGVFKGQMTFDWYVNDHGDFLKNEFEIDSDSYRNNQWEGRWQKYGSQKNKMANWGESRIPNSEALDIGTAEFTARKRYLKNGWQDKKDKSSQK